MLPPSKDKSVVLFDIEPNSSSFKIAQDLKKSNLIKSVYLFLIYLKLKKAVVQAGVYELSPSYSLSELTEKLLRGEVKEWVITFPEGFSIKEMAERLQKEGVIKKEEFLKETSLVSKYKKEFDFIDPLAPSLEGYLFPDTYRFSYRASPEDIIKKMLLNFKKRTENIKPNYKTLILASIVERESKSLEDKKMIASVYFNRLNVRMKLEADPTVQYAKGNWEPITVSDYKIESPYNTYKYHGLPPSPICNPGLEALKAVIEPQKTDYFYFFHTQDGKTIFSKSKEEHDKNKADYLKLRITP